MEKINKKSIITISVISLALGFASPIAALAASPATVNLGASGNFVILAKTGISTTGVTSITGDIGLSPAAATYITGFALDLPAASAFSTSALITGKAYAPGYADPTPANLTTAVSNMEAAYTDTAGRASNVTELGAGNIGGMTLAPGVYKWSTGVTISSDLFLSGGANDVWIFQVAQNLDISSATKIVLSGGAQASNIFWVVAGQTTLGTTSTFNGNILDQTTIVLNTGATLYGRALAQAAVTLDANTVTKPETVVSVPVTTPVVTATPATPAVSATPAAPAVPTVSPAVPATSSSSDPRIATLQAQLNVLTTTLRARQSQQIAQQGSSAPSSAFGQQVRAIAINLGKGSRDNSVTTLQHFLISQNKGPSAEALANVGATTYFGELTRKALAEFQASVGISPALGNFGSITRAYINSH